VAWKDLAGIPFITIAGDNAFRRRYDRYLRDAGVTTAPIFEVRQLLTMLGLIAAGLGIGVWPSSASPVARYYNVALRPLVNPRAVHVISIITARGRTLSPATESFVAMMKTYAGSYSKRLAVA